jgi:membrane-associated phospholipid phosphatase
MPSKIWGGMSRRSRGISPKPASRVKGQRVDNREQERVARFGGIVLAGFVAAVAVLYAFAWLADQVLDQETQALDFGTLAWLQTYSSPSLTLAAEAVSLMGSQVILLLGALLLGLFAWQRRWGAAAMLLLVVGGAEVLNSILKSQFHRTRPTDVSGFIDAQQFSFPSGHAMVSAAFYFYLAYLTRRLIHGRWRGVLVTGLIVLVLLIGLSRLYLEAHYLSDVVAGYLAGFLWTDSVILGSQALMRRRERKRTRGTLHR